MNRVPISSEYSIQQILQTLAEQPEALHRTYCWLLSCGSEAADHAYQSFFQQLGLQIESPPQLNELPEGAIAQMDRRYLEHLWQHPDALNFDDRLNVAALLSWNLCAEL